MYVHFKKYNMDIIWVRFVRQSRLFYWNTPRQSHKRSKQIRKHSEQWCNAWM